MSHQENGVNCNTKSLPKKFLSKDTTNVVNDLIEGLLLTHPNTLQRLEGHDVLLANPLPSNKGKQRVTLLSGGGSGHEPSHAGWIGNGMLTGAVLGGVFASPSVKSVLAAIRAVNPVSIDSHDDGGRGCLLIVKNYTGDRLNFGMACEMANAEGRRTKMVVVADDCAVPRTKGITGARGVAGTVFVHKVAGAVAAQGCGLDEVAEWATFAASRIGSLGVALEAVTLPGAVAKNTRLDGNKIEIGMGIHGEAGIRQSHMMSVDDIAKEKLLTIRNFGYKCHRSADNEVSTLKEGDEVVVLVNNLGGASNFEISILARSVIRQLEGEMKCFVVRAYVGAYMTSFNMHGASVSVMCLSGEDSGDLGILLDAPTDAPAWVKAEVMAGKTRPSMIPLPEITAPGTTMTPNGGEGEVKVTIGNFSSIASSALAAACEAILASEAQLTEWDTIVGDGDCGLTMARGAKELLRRLEKGALPVSNPSALYLAIADAVSTSMGGTSGVLFELFFRKSAVSLIQLQKEGKGVDGSALSKAFVDGVNALTFYGGASVGSCTMMDALCPASAEDIVSRGLDAMAAVALEGADSSVEMNQALAGRSNYLSEEQIGGTPDPGAKAVATILNAIARSTPSAA